MKRTTSTSEWLRILATGARDERKKAAEKLGARMAKSPEPGAAGPLHAALDDEYLWVRYRVAEALAELRAPSSLVPLVARVAVESHPRVLAALALALGRLGRPEAADAVVRAFRGASDTTNTHLFTEALVAMGPAVVLPLVDELRKNTPGSPHGRRGVMLKVLGQLADPRAFDAVAEAVAAGPEADRSQACMALVEIDAARAEVVLSRAVLDPSRDVRQWAAMALARVPDAASTALLGPLTHGKDEEKKSVLRVLDAGKGPLSAAFAAPLFPFLGTTLHTLAVRALGRIPKETLSAIISEALPSFFARLAASARPSPLTADVFLQEHPYDWYYGLLGLSKHLQDTPAFAQLHAQACAQPRGASEDVDFVLGELEKQLGPGLVPPPTTGEV